MTTTDDVDPRIVACGTCSAAKGAACTTPKGNPAKRMHGWRRIQATHQSMAERKGALGVACSHCKAPVGEACRKLFNGVSHVKRERSAGVGMSTLPVPIQTDDIVNATHVDAPDPDAPYVRPEDQRYVAIEVRRRGMPPLNGVWDRVERRLVQQVNSGATYSAEYAARSLNGRDKPPD